MGFKHHKGTPTLNQIILNITPLKDYALLLQYLGRRDGLIVDTPVGSFLNLGAVGWTADERHLPNSSIIKCQVNNIGAYWPPVDAALLELSVWDGTLTWATSYWR